MKNLKLLVVAAMTGLLLVACDNMEKKHEVKVVQPAPAPVTVHVNTPAPEVAPAPAPEVAPAPEAEVPAQ